MSPPDSSSHAARWARFQPPRRQASHVDRPRVRSLIDAAVDEERVTVVTAPSGFGKTSAVSEWAASLPGRVAWLTLSAFDADPIRLGAGIVQTLQSLARSDARTEIADVLAIDPGSQEPGAILNSLADSLDGSTHPVYLVIDDAQRAAEALTDGLLGALIDMGPEPLHLVIVGTSYVELALSRWALTHPGALIRAEQLAFDIDEISAMISGTQTSLTAELIFEETRGWPIAIQVVHMTGVAPRSRDGHDEELMRDYVREHVLGGLPPHLSAFVLATSICSTLTVELAAAVSSRPDAEHLLRECVRIGLFIDRFDTDHGAIYRWHSRFAGHCRAIMKLEDPEQPATLHRAAAEFLETSDPLTAIAHWLAAGDVDDAVTAIRSHWVSILVGTESASLERICTTLPARHAEDPSILLIRACAQDIAGSHDLARITLASAQSRASQSTPDAEYELNLPRAQLFLLDDRASVTKASAAVQAQLRGADDIGAHDHAALLYVLGWTEMRHRNNPDRTVQLLSAAAQEADAVGDGVLSRRARNHLAFVLAWTGRFARARTILEDLDDHLDDIGPWNAYAGGGAFAAAGLMAYFSNDLPRASHELSRAVRSGSGKHAFAGIARMLLAVTAAATKDSRALRRAGLELQEMPAEDSQAVSWTAFRHTALASLAEAAGQRDRALAIAARYAEADDLPLASVILAGIVRRSGDPMTALQMLRRLSRYEGVPYIQAATLLTAAVVHRRRENMELTHDLCEQSLEVAVGENIRRPFCDGDLEMRQLLSEHLSWGTRYEDFIAAGLRPAETSSPLELLSEREKAVFDQLRTTRTMSEIAESLDVSINTVKTHQRAIYRKLEVSSRREALRLLT